MSETANIKGRGSRVDPAIAKKHNEQFREDTGSRLKDKWFNWIVDRYSRNGHVFKFSDRVVWTGAVYVVPEMLGYLVFFAVFLALAHFSFNKYGEARTVVFFILLLIWRVQMGVKQLASLNKKLQVE